jgi:hypothetical protein
VFEVVVGVVFLLLSALLLLLSAMMLFCMVLIPCMYDEICFL